MRSLALAPLLAVALAAHAGTAPPAKSAASAIAPSYKDLKFAPLGKVVIPKPDVVTLPNGVKLYLLEDHELPLISGFALVRTGNLFEPAAKTGLATVTGMVMRTGGTRAKTGDQIDQQLEDVAASVESSIGESSGRVSFSCLKENAADVLAIFKDILTQPEFRQDRIDLAKTQLKSSISRRNDDADEIADREFTDTLYGKDTPYGRRMEYATVDAISRADLIAFHKRYFFPANTMIAVYGDFSTTAMRAEIEKLFADWTVTEPPVPPFPKVTAKAQPGVFFADKNDVTQTFFDVGHLGGTLRDKDFPALTVMADILGGGFSSRLFKRIRTQMGVAYHIGADWGADYDHAGLFEISGSTKSHSTVETLQAVRQEIDRIRTSEVTESELKTSKDKVANSFVFNFDRPSKTLSRLVTYDYFGYPRDFIFEYQKAISSTTRADVLRAAKEHIDPADLTYVAVGNPKEFGEPLAAMNLPVKAIDLTIPVPKAPETKVDAASLAQGRALLQRAQQAVGGAAKLAAVKDFSEKAEMKMLAAGGMVIQQANQWLAPSQFRQELVLPFGKQIVYFDGKSGWMVTPQGAMPMPPMVISQVQSQLFRFWFPLLLSDRDPGRTVNGVGDGVIEISDKQGHRVRLQIDTKNGLPEKLIYQMNGVGGPQTVEEIYGGYQDVSGIQLPFKMTIRQGSRVFSEVRRQDVKLNTGLKTEDLDKKQ